MTESTPQVADIVYNCSNLALSTEVLNTFASSLNSDFSTEMKDAMKKKLLSKHGKADTLDHKKFANKFYLKQAPSRTFSLLVLRI